MKKYTFFVAGTNDDGYQETEILHIYAKNEADAEIKANEKTYLKGPNFELSGIK